VEGRNPLAPSRRTYENITIAVDDALYRHARICAAHRETTLTELVRDFLLGLEIDPGLRAQGLRKWLAEFENTENAH
jgi:hypothetical protein